MRKPTRKRPATPAAATEKQPSWRELAEQQRAERAAACAKIIEEACVEFGCELHAFVEVGPFGVSGSRVQVIAKDAE